VAFRHGARGARLDVALCVAQKMQRGAHEVFGPFARRWTRSSHALIIPNKRDEKQLKVPDPDRKPPLSTSPPRLHKQSEPAQIPLPSPILLRNPAKGIEPVKFEFGNRILVPNGNESEQPSFQLNAMGYVEFQKPQSETSKTLDQQKIGQLIEKCLELYLSEDEIISYLEAANVPPTLTQSILAKLELRNPEFFEYYKLQLQIKEQITHFNATIELQAESLASAGVPMTQAFGLKPPPPRQRLGSSAQSSPSASAPGTPSHQAIQSPFEIDATPADGMGELDLFDISAKFDPMDYDILGNTAEAGDLL
jgi:uncharacterized protein (TIGR01589 family)